MNGAVIIIATLLAVAGVFLIGWGSFILLEQFNKLYNDTPTEEQRGLKIILLIPYIILAIWCGIIQVLITLLTLGLAIDAARNFRNWWHQKQ